ncbi:hypothetical protein J3R83DRAFT_2305, partial [Lanmaoa asiatica]
DWNSTQMDLKGFRTVGRASAARRDEKRETDVLADHKASQHGKRKREAMNIPGPPNQRAKRPREPINPPRRRGRLESHPREVSHTRIENIDLPSQTV